MSNIVPVGKDLSKATISNTIKINTIDDLQRLSEILSKSGFFLDQQSLLEKVDIQVN